MKEGSGLGKMKEKIIALIEEILNVPAGTITEETMMEV